MYPTRPSTFLLFYFTVASIFFGATSVIAWWTGERFFSAVMTVATVCYITVACTTSIRYVRRVGEYEASAKEKTLYDDALDELKRLIKGKETHLHHDEFGVVIVRPAYWSLATTIIIADKTVTRTYTVTTRKALVFIDPTPPGWRQASRRQQRRVRLPQGVFHASTEEIQELVNFLKRFFPNGEDM